MKLRSRKRSISPVIETPRKVKTPRKVAYSSPKKPIISPARLKSFRPPSNWLRVYQSLCEIRHGKDAIPAPVDEMGCDKLFWEMASPKTRRYHILTSLMLSSQTKDTTTAQAMRQLHEYANKKLKHDKPEGLTLNSVLLMSNQELNSCINKVGFHRRKTEYIKEAAIMLRRDFEGDVPKSVEELVKLPGVGPKMAHLAVQACWDKVEGIGVDTHVHRISSRFKWVPYGTYEKGPEATRIALESWLPEEYWSEINHLMVGHGQTICLPRNPLCHQCPLKGICPSSSVKKKKE